MKFLNHFLPNEHIFQMLDKSYERGLEVLHKDIDT